MFLTPPGPAACAVETTPSIAGGAAMVVTVLCNVLMWVSCSSLCPRFGLVVRRANLGLHRDDAPWSEVLPVKQYETSQCCCFNTILLCFTRLIRSRMLPMEAFY